MAAAGAPPPDCLAFGTRCSVAACTTGRDFLPFTCSRCQRPFCLDHRGTHGCAPPSRTVLPCPVCARGVELPDGVAPDDEAGVSRVVDAHMRSAACNPANYARVHAKPRCPAPGCKAALTLVNKYDCKACGRTVCLTHRHGADHGCPASAAAAGVRGAPPAARPGAAAAFRALRQALSRPGSASSGGAAPPPPLPQPTPPRPPSISAALEAAAAAQRLVGGPGPRVAAAGAGAGAGVAQPAHQQPLSPRSAAAAAAERRAVAAGVRGGGGGGRTASCALCGGGPFTSSKALRAHQAAAHPGEAAPAGRAGSCSLS